MTDKIIIDGIDVSKCYYYTYEPENYCNVESSEFGCSYCDDDPDCYYKQLKRKEQECEELKKSMDVIVEHSRYYKKEYKRLIKQTKQLKQVLDEIEGYCEEQNLKYDTTACDILSIIDKVKEQ